MSYVRFDDQHEEGRLTQFRERLSGEIRLQTGEPFDIFQDRNDIKWGEQWKARIEDTLNAVTFFIPIITPGFFKSPACREELECFLNREKKLKRGDLILPVYYVECPVLSNAAKRKTDALAEILAARNYADWRGLRFEPLTNPAVGKTLAQLATQVVAALDRAPAAVKAPAANSSRRKPTRPSAEGDQSAGSATTTVSTGTSKRSARTEPPTLIVDAMHRSEFPTISAALAAAAPGSRILVRPGLYKEGIVIDKPVEIVGYGELAEVVVEASGKNVVLFKANMGRLANLTLRQAGGGKWFAVDISQGRLELEGCDITSQSLACVAIHGGADPRLRRNRIHNGNEAGVLVYENGLGTLDDNDIFANARAGVAITSGANPSLRRNRIHDGKEGGVFVYESGLGTLDDNDIFANTRAGVEIKTDGNPTLRRNRIHDGKGSGVFVNQNGLGTLEDNDIFANAFAGVVTTSGGNPTLRRNRIHDGKQAGVFVYESGLGTLEDNDIFANARAGVEIKSGGNPTLRRNRITKNGYQAVWVYEGGGTFKDNDLRENACGAWEIAADCANKVTRARNLE